MLFRYTIHQIQEDAFLRNLEHFRSVSVSGNAGYVLLEVRSINVIISVYYWQHYLKFRTQITCYQRADGLFPFLKSISERNISYPLKKIFIYLVAQGLWLSGFSSLARMNPGLLPWEPGVLATGPPAKSGKLPIWKAERKKCGPLSSTL